MNNKHLNPLMKNILDSQLSIHNVVRSTGFEKYYHQVTNESGVQAKKKYVRILWDNGYTIDEAIHNLKTMDED